VGPSPPAAQAALAIVLQQYQQRLAALERRVRELEERLGQNSTNSSKPPSSDGPAVKRAPPRPRGVRPKGGQPGYPRHTRPLLPPDHVEQLRPTACRRYGHALQGDDPAPQVHQVLELPPIRPVVTEYRRHRLCCPHCHTSTCAALSAAVAGTSAGPRLQAAVALLAVVVVQAKADLVQVVTALEAPRGPPHLLYGGEEQADQHAHDGDDDEQLDQREAAPGVHGERPRVLRGSAGPNGKAIPFCWPSLGQGG
jgi:transposase